MSKSTRHSKIIGNFGEMLICNWLSRSGFEVCVVDHTGIDLIASRGKTGRMGVTVKSRTRHEGQEHVSVNLFREKAGDRRKVTLACKAFGCKPWIGIYVEGPKAADMFLITLSHYDRKYRVRGNEIEDWKMTQANLDRYAKDRHVLHVHVEFRTEQWPWTLRQKP